MRWSWKLGQVAGIGIFVHWTFLILVGWIVLTNAPSGLAATLETLALVLTLFGCVVLHELGHALTARAFGVATRDITLLPIGGVARMERIPEDPTQEFWIAIAGPAVNVVIALALFGWLAVRAGLASVTAWTPEADVSRSDFLTTLMVANVFLVLFNLVPAFPMDGGRVLRASLACITGNYVGATRIAAAVGQGIAILFGFLGLFTNPFLVFIALFVYLGAQEEAQQVQERAEFRGVPVRAAMMTRLRTLAPGDTLTSAAHELLAGAQQDFPIVEAGRLVGLLQRGDLVRVLADGGGQQPIEAVMLREFPTATEDEPLGPAFERMRAAGVMAMPVVRGGQLAGVLTAENVAEWSLVRAALAGSSGPVG